MKITAEIKEAVADLIEIHYGAFTPDKTSELTTKIRNMEPDDFDGETKEKIALIIDTMAKLLLTDMNILEEIIAYEESQ